VHDSLLNNHKLQNVILGKMTATSEDMEVLGSYLMREQCGIRRLHLLSLDFEHENVTIAKNDRHDIKNKNWQDSFLQLVRHNRSLMEISLHAASTTAGTNVVPMETRCPTFSRRTVDSRESMMDNTYHVQKELQSLMMRNNYLTRGLARIEDVRLLPQYIYHHVNMGATTVDDVDQSCDNGPSTVTPLSPVDVMYFMVKQRPDLFCSRHCAVEN
jgi:hypothetical protein